MSVVIIVSELKKRKQADEEKGIFLLHLITSNNCLPNNIIVKICDFYTETPL